MLSSLGAHLFRAKAKRSFLRTSRNVSFGPLFVGLVGLIGGCGGGSAGNTGTGSTVPPSASVTSVSVTCSPSTIQSGQTSQCTSSVAGTGNFSATVSWNVTGSVAGSVDKNGLYTAPATVSSSTQVTITATSIQDSTKSGSSTVVVNPAATITSVLVSCTPSDVQPGGTSQCSAKVQGTENFSSAVTWSVSSGGGTINPSGLYTAPNTAGAATVQAASVQDSAKL